MPFQNSYADKKRAEAYARLEYPGTYYLAFRDIPEIIGAHVDGNAALDFGCGTGRSTRLLKTLGFDTVGIDISEEMVAEARGFDPDSEYHVVGEDDLSALGKRRFDLVFAAFTFDNIPTRAKKVALFTAIAKHLNPGGVIVNLVSSPEIYLHEWASFSTKDFPENKNAQTGDPVKIIITAIDDARPVTDIVWPDQAYQDVYRASGLDAIATHKPLARPDEPFDWINETRIAPWTITVLTRRS